jgi:hypothetical protein
MPDLMTTPFDRHFDTGAGEDIEYSADATTHHGALKRAWQWVADICYITLNTCGFVASTLLMVLGFPLLAFFIIAGWDLGLLAANVGNFAQHFLGVDPSAQADFAESSKWAFLAVVAIVHLLRFPNWLVRLWAGLERGQAR